MPRTNCVVRRLRPPLWWPVASLPGGCRLPSSGGCRHLPPIEHPLILDTSGGGLQHISSGVFFLKAKACGNASASDPNC